MKPLFATAVLAGALASGPALAGHGSFHAHHAGFHGGHGHVGFGVFIGPPLFWPWYYPPAYYYPPPPTVYYTPPPTVYYPPPVVAPSPPAYYPQAAAPNPSGSAVIELPNNEPPQQSSPPRLTPNASAQPGRVVAQGPAKQLFMYPKQGQSAEQQARDRDECYRWAMGQVGNDGNQPSGPLSQAQASDYYRAMEACLDAHGYSVR